MIGLKYITNINNTKLTSLANELGIKKQSLSDWANGRSKIPNRRLDQLEDIFGIPKSYIMKELTSVDKIQILQLEINKLKLQK